MPCTLKSCCLLAATTLATFSHAQDCPYRGKLVLSDKASPQIRSVSLTSGTVMDEYTMASADTNEIHLTTDSSRQYTVCMYRGTQDEYYANGVVEFLDARLRLATAVDAPRVIHTVSHAGLMALFGDGHITDERLVNATIVVVDESKVGTPDAIPYQTQIPSAHHGIAIPVDDDHVLYSLPVPERLAGNAGRQYALPGTFQVTDYTGRVLHSLTDTSNTDTSCSGFHGEYAVDHTLILACDDDHGGVVVVDYDPVSETYSSRSLLYPTNYNDHRTGSFAYHPAAPRAVGNFAAADAYYLVSFTPQDEQMQSSYVLELPEQQQACDFVYDLQTGEYLYVWMPTGMLLVYQVHPSWKLVGSIQVVQESRICTQTLFASGYQAVTVVQGNTLYVIDTKDPTSQMTVQEFALDFEPFDMVLLDGTDSCGTGTTGGTSSSSSSSASMATCSSWMLSSLLVWNVVS